MLTETTAELALALTFAAARRVVEGDEFMRGGHYKGWLPTLFVGNLLQVGAWGARRGRAECRAVAVRRCRPSRCCTDSRQGTPLGAQPAKPSAELVHHLAPSGTSPALPPASASQNKTVGIIGAGRIGTAYARMMVEGHKCDLVYYDPYPNQWLEDYVR